MNAHAMPNSWSDQQDQALVQISNWFRNPDRQVFRLFGYAGTGKTTLARQIALDVKGYVHFGAFTGKAANVLRQKGCSGAGTIHSIIYDSKTKPDGTVRFRKKNKKEFEGVPLIVIDECSMVDEQLGQDLMSFGVPILVIGDPAQLPPVRGAGFFTDHDPDFMLTEVHRQAAENPIIRLSMDIREGKALHHGDYGAVRVISRNDVEQADVTGADQILCGLNRTRANYNRRLREIYGREGEMPENGDRLVCLKNNRDNHLFNGSIWEVTDIQNMSTDHKAITVRSEDTGNAVRCDVLNACWDGSLGDMHWMARKGYDEFTYGYALTVHKSQGSQWNNVMLFDESFAFRDDAARHLYTGVTRAAERLTVVR